MLKEEEDKNTYTFSIKKNKYEVFFADDGGVEVYDIKDPSKTGFVFYALKDINIFVNMLTDILEKKNIEEEIDE